MTTKAILQGHIDRERKRATQATDAYNVLWSAMQNIRQEAREAARKGNMLNNIWLIEYITEQITIAQQKKNQS